MNGTADRTPDTLFARTDDRVRILGLPADRLSSDDAVDAVARAAAEGRTLRIAVNNANKMWLARTDARLRSYIETAGLVVPEWALVWAARRLGLPPLEPVLGVELASRLLREADARGWSVYLLGARQEVLDALVARLGRERPGLRLAGAHHGYLDEAAEERVRREIVESEPDLLLVAMGSPRQEHFIASLPADRGPRTRMGVGGSFDVLAGLKRDTPPWARANGLEWLYRTMQDPWRLGRRYLVVNPWFVGAVLRERWTRTRAGS